jgi:hypothetical protein
VAVPLAGEVVVLAVIPVAHLVFQQLLLPPDLLSSAGHPDIKE